MVAPARRTFAAHPRGQQLEETFRQFVELEQHLARVEERLALLLGPEGDGKLPAAPQDEPWDGWP